MIELVVALLVVLVVCYLIVTQLKKRRQKEALAPKSMPEAWREILTKNVTYYKKLNNTERALFEKRVLSFLASVVITPVKTSITDEEKVLIGAAAIIPIFRLQGSQYPNLEEVLVYPNAFNHDFEVEGHNKRISGMVGSGFMNGTMILSKSHIFTGFMNPSDGNNTPIHEFIHLIDGWDGDIDGVPKALMSEPMLIPWIEAIRQGINDIRTEDSRLDSYGGTNSQEFLAVASEYFFESPARLKADHPEIFELMNKMFGNNKL